MKGLLARIDALSGLLFRRHAGARRHEVDRRRFRALHPTIAFETYIVRLYTLSWVVALLVVGVAIHLFAPALSNRGPITIPTPRWLVESGLVHGATSSDPSNSVAAATGGMDPLVVLGPTAQTVSLAILVGGLVYLLLHVGAKAGLAYLVGRRRAAIERTLPGAVRYLHVIAAGTTDPRALFDAVVEKRRIHGATADSLAAIQRHAAMTGSVDAGIRRVARDTPAKESLAPFLRTFRKRYREGPEPLREFLARESRLLAAEDERTHERESRYLTAVVELFVVLLVLPVILVIGTVAATVALPDRIPAVAIATLPDMTWLLAAAGSAVILVLGGVAAFFTYLLRPSGHRWAAPSPSRRPQHVLRTCLRNPTNAAIVVGPIAAVVTIGLWAQGMPTEHAIVLGYVFLALPVGLVDVRRAWRRAAMDRMLPSFVHAVAERVDRGEPFRTAVERLAERKDFGPLQPHVSNLAYDLSVGGHDGPVRKRALERFIGRIGTPLAGRTIGLAVGALDAGADTRSAIATLQTETGRLVHAERTRRSRFPVVIGLGWTVALLIVVIVVSMNLMVLDSVTAVTPGPVQGVVVDATFGSAVGERPLFYVLTLASMLASGWFAGIAGRGVYEGLLHSGGLVAITFLVFRVVGLI